MGRTGRTRVGRGGVTEAELPGQRRAVGAAWRFWSWIIVGGMWDFCHAAYHCLARSVLGGVVKGEACL